MDIEIGKYWKMIEQHSYDGLSIAKIDYQRLSTECENSFTP